MSSRALPGGDKSLANPLNPALAAGHRTFRFGPACRGGQDDIGQLRRFGEKDILDHQVIQSFEEASGAHGIRFGLGGVLADDVERSKLLPLPWPRT